MGNAREGWCSSSSSSAAATFACRPQTEPATESVQGGQLQMQLDHSHGGADPSTRCVSDSISNYYASHSESSETGVQLPIRGSSNGGNRRLSSPLRLVFRAIHATLNTSPGEFANLKPTFIARTGRRLLSLWSLALALSACPQQPSSSSGEMLMQSSSTANASVVPSSSSTYPSGSSSTHSDSITSNAHSHLRSTHRAPSQMPLTLHQAREHFSKQYADAREIMELTRVLSCKFVDLVNTRISRLRRIDRSQAPMSSSEHHNRSEADFLVSVCEKVRSVILPSSHPVWVAHPHASQVLSHMGASRRRTSYEVAPVSSSPTFIPPFPVILTRAASLMAAENYWTDFLSLIRASLPISSNSDLNTTETNDVHSNRGNADSSHSNPSDISNDRHRNVSNNNNNSDHNMRSSYSSSTSSYIFSPNPYSAAARATAATVISSRSRMNGSNAREEQIKGIQNCLGNIFCEAFLAMDTRTLEHVRQLWIHIDHYAKHMKDIQGLTYQMIDIEEDLEELAYVLDDKFLSLSS